MINMAELNKIFIDEDKVEDEMKFIGVDKIGISLMKDKFKFRVIKIPAVLAKYCNIIKQDMLSVGGEAAVNKGCISCSIEKSDILLGGTIKQLRKLGKKILSQPKECKDIGKQLLELLE